MRTEKNFDTKKNSERNRKVGQRIGRKRIGDESRKKHSKNRIKKVRKNTRDVQKKKQTTTTKKCKDKHCLVAMVVAGMVLMMMMAMMMVMVVMMMMMQQVNNNKKNKYSAGEQVN